ncbi:GntR family transcriptional regulator [Acidobacteriia bacterium AH_259_A11_L15]|nr:GntR family transcriptional regulator [Acidobacteriia bacterium AH_259_A11_L15]
MRLPTLRHKTQLATRFLSRQPLCEQVHNVLRRMIVEGQLKPGAKILEGRVAAILGVSRTPVREALRQLESDGLVVSRPGYSTRVTTLTVADIEEIYPLVAVLEGLAARLATPRLSNADLDYMRELTDALACYARSGKIQKLVQADTQFHAMLHERSQNRRLQRIVQELRGQVERFEYVFFSSKQAVRASVKRHKNLVRVLKRRDALAAQRSLARQWDLGRRAVVSMVREKKMALEKPEEISRPLPTPMKTLTATL